MNILIVGGTRFFGIPMTRSLIAKGHDITLATRSGKPFFGEVPNLSYTALDRTDGESVKRALGGRHFDLIIDKIAYSSNDVRALLGNVGCGRYIQMSTCAVYTEQHPLIGESEFKPAEHPLEWKDRTPDYAGGKRLAERAALEYMAESDCTFVRYPVVLGINDYTGRLRFYAEHIKSGKPFFCDCLTAGVSYINETEAGEFISHLADHPISGAVNGCSSGVVSQGDIISKLEALTGKKANLAPDGDPAPYNGTLSETSYSTEKAAASGFVFSDIGEWIDPLAEHTARI